MLYLAKVIDIIDYEDCVQVLLLGGSSDKAKCKVLHQRANPLYGNSGNLPDIGEKGLVAKIESYGDEFFWIGSFHDLVENICTEETGKRITHDFNDIWTKVDKDANIEYSHPSGLFMKISKKEDSTRTTLDQRKRFIRKDGSVNLKRAVDYNLSKSDPVSIYIEHTRKRGTSHTDATYANDKRKQTKTYDLKKTKIDVDNDGDITLTHETDTDGKSFTLNIDKDGNMTINCPRNIVVNTDIDVTYNTTRDMNLVTTRNNVQTTTGNATRQSNNVSETATNNIQDTATNITDSASNAITQYSNSHAIYSNALTVANRAGTSALFQYANGEFRIWGNLRLMTGNLYIDEGNEYIHQGDLVVGTYGEHHGDIIVYGDIDVNKSLVQWGDGDITAEGSIIDAEGNTANHTH